MIHTIALTGSSIVIGIMLVGIIFSLENMIK